MLILRSKQVSQVRKESRNHKPTSSLLNLLFFLKKQTFSFGKICQLVLTNTCETLVFLKITNIWKSTKFSTDYKKLVGIGVLSEGQPPKFQPCFSSGLSSIIRWKSCENLYSACSNLHSPPCPPTFLWQKRASSACFANVFRCFLLFTALTQFITECYVFESMLLPVSCLPYALLDPCCLSNDLVQKPYQWSSSPL